RQEQRRQKEHKRQEQAKQRQIDQTNVALVKRIEVIVPDQLTGQTVAGEWVSVFNGRSGRNGRFRGGRGDMPLTVETFRTCAAGCCRAKKPSAVTALPGAGSWSGC